MGVLIIILLASILLGQLGILFIIFHIEKWLSILCSLEPEEEQPEAKVSDPYTKPKELYSSSSQIVVPKTPSEIRNQNFNKLKEGIQYGDIVKR